MRKKWNNLIRKFRINDVFMYCIAPYIHRVIDGNVDECREMLNKYSKKPNGTSIGENTISDNPAYDVQVIVPVYNVEEYVRECLDSILNQKTNYKIKIVVVDDGSTDASRKIVDEYQKHENILIFHQNNGGSAAARNAGLKYIDARYITFVDSDDLLEPNAIQSAVEIADFYQADMVEGGIYSIYNKEKQIRVKEKTIKQINTLRDAHGLPWGGIYINSVFSRIIFPQGYWFEDTMNGFIVIPQIRNGYSIPEMFYNYRDNPKSISYTSKVKPKVIDTYWITEQMVKEHELLNLPHDTYFYEMFLNQVICNYKRLKSFPMNIQEAVFVLTCDLADGIFLSVSKISLHLPLIKAMINRDFGVYRWYCKTR